MLIVGGSCNYKAIYNGSYPTNSYTCYGCSSNTYVAGSSNFTVTTNTNSSAPWANYLYVNHGLNSSTTYYNATLTITTFSNAPCLDPCPGGIYMINTFYKCVCNDNRVIDYPSVCSVNCSSILYTNGTISTMECIC